MRYILDLSEKQAEVVATATELLARVFMGQMDSVSRALVGAMMRRGELDDGDGSRLRDVENMRALLEKAQCIYTQRPANASFGILQYEVPDQARMAYDIHQVVRHRIAWNKHPDGGIQVWFDTPRKTSNEVDVMPSITSIGQKDTGKPAKKTAGRKKAGRKKK